MGIKLSWKILISQGSKTVFLSFIFLDPRIDNNSNHDGIMLRVPVFLSVSKVASDCVNSSRQNVVNGQKFPNSLCGINTRQLELLLWRTGLTAQHFQDCPIFYILLNYTDK